MRTGTTRADNSRPSIADLPYEMQASIFEAAMGPQVFFMEIANEVLTFSRPADKGLALACRLSREIYIKSKKLCEFGSNFHWVDPEQDIFYLYQDDGMRLVRPSIVNTRLPGGERFDASVLQNVAVDLQYLGEHPRRDAAIRIWTIFPSLKTLHVFVPDGPPRTPALDVTPETLVLCELRRIQVVAPPGQDKELWSAVKYQLIKTCSRILDSENGWNGRTRPEVVGHLTRSR
ncbi:hypothetical protein MMYC01_204593 [Madurella mycetomatis]|uniref:Uncharacterized protein n=1 Tax=Madurella mycetomatis TaxID=100816 RepID=A0A175W583_9PEZI|nr:hypothetical protein MMYC01_204593 [Madurella mycetomatis]